MSQPINTPPLEGIEMSALNTRRKRLHHELIAEIIGCAVVIIFGDGVVATFTQLDNPNFPAAAPSGFTPDPYAKNNYVNMSWGVGVCFGVLLSFDTSGAVLNSALQLNAIVNNGFSLRKGVFFVLAQMFGSFIGAFITTLNFVVLKNHPEHELRNFYCTQPVPGVTSLNSAFNEFLATALLAMGLAAVTNNRPTFNKFHVGPFAGLLVYGLGNVFGPQSGYAMNPARDFGPRMCYLLFALIYGHQEKNRIWEDVLGRGYFVVPIIAPCLGALVGGLIYKHLIFLEAADAETPSRWRSVRTEWPPSEQGSVLQRKCAPTSDV